jgi:hypothetical protein
MRKNDRVTRWIGIRAVYGTTISLFYRNPFGHAHLEDIQVKQNNRYNDVVCTCSLLQTHTHLPEFLVSDSFNIFGIMSATSHTHPPAKVACKQVGARHVDAIKYDPRPCVRIVPSTGLMMHDRDYDISTCPFCNDTREGNLQITDYVDYPMLWCNGCDARSVLDPDAYDKYERDMRDCETMHAASTRDLGQPPDDTPVEANIPLLWIARMCDSHMYRVRSTRALTADEMNRLIHSYSLKKHDNWYDPAVVESMGCEDREESPWYGSNTNTVMNVSVPVGSYNVETPSVSYGPNVDTSHDGTYVFLQVVKMDGSDQVISYSGD